VVLFIARGAPHDVPGAFDFLGYLPGRGHPVGLAPPPEPTADQMVVDHDFFQRQAGGSRRRRLGSSDGLDTDPDLTVVIADMNRAVHRLHRRVGEERNLVNRGLATGLFFTKRLWYWLLLISAAGLA
jgi:hypothetical protein